MTLKITSPLGMQVVDIISFLFPLLSTVNPLTPLEFWRWLDFLSERSAVNCQRIDSAKGLTPTTSRQPFDSRKIYNNIQ